MKKYYHVTPKENVESILTKGLIPQVGERSKELNEDEGVFLFPTLDDMETALGQWLGEVFGDEELVSLEIILGDDFPIKDSTVEYEKISQITIPYENIKYFRFEG